MDNIKSKNPVRHAVIWIAIYVLLVNLGELASGWVGVSNSASVVILLAFSFGLLRYLKQHQWGEYYGLRSGQYADLRTAFFYIPLVFIVALQFSTGINRALAPGELRKH